MPIMLKTKSSNVLLFPKDEENNNYFKMNTVPEDNQ